MPSIKVNALHRHSNKALRGCCLKAFKTWISTRAFLRDHPLCQNQSRPAAFGTYLTGVERRKPVGGLLSFAASAFVVLPAPPSQQDSDNDADRFPLARDKSLELLSHSSDPKGHSVAPRRMLCSQTASFSLPFYIVAGENESHVRDFISINLLLTLKLVT